MTDRERTATVQVLDGLVGRILDIREKTGKPIAACVKYGGYGDFYLLTCIGMAAARKLGQAVQVILVAQSSGATPDLDLNGIVPDEIEVIRIPPVDVRVVLRALRDCCEIVYHAPGYAVRRWTKAGFDDAGQAEADAALEPWAEFYDGFPDSNAKLEVSQWHVARESSALPITCDDIGPCRLYMPKITPAFAPARMLFEHSSRLIRRAALNGVSLYVVIHNKAGGGNVTKAIPDDTMQAIVDTVNDLGMRAVQVGAKGEKRYRNAIDRRGLRWPLQSMLIGGAQWYVGLEGGLAYAAWGNRTRALIGTGPTPFAVFGFPNAIAMRPIPLCRPCWYSDKCWQERCPKGHAHCVNFPTPDEARELVRSIMGAESPYAECS